MWTEEKYNDLIYYFQKESDPKYLDFTKNITNSKVPMLGVSIPKIKLKTKEYGKSDISSFLKFYKGSYFEERMFFGLLIAYSNNINIYDKYLKRYAKEISDWSLCDSVATSLKLIKKNPDHFYPFINELINSKYEFSIRFGLIILLSQYMNDNYIDQIINICLNLKSDYYYVNMAISWLLCECFIKYKANTMPYINKDYLSPFILNKTISKINDSFRVSKEDKEILKKRKN
jgi:3-methyladenine DNA glycosylase AlkD